MLQWDKKGPIEVIFFKKKKKSQIKECPGKGWTVMTGFPTARELQPRVEVVVFCCAPDWKL